MDDPQNIKYENLHKEYKKLSDEYEALTKKNGNKSEIDNKLNQLIDKKEEIAKEFLKIIKSQ